MYRSTLLAATILGLWTSPAALAQDRVVPEAAVPGAAAARTESADALIDGFRQPPATARPRVWWHWLSGNVSTDGITKDLEWMRRTGIAGAMMFDGDMGTEQVVPRRVTVLSPEWHDSLRHAATESRRLGLEFTMAAAPGWSETGGPWVTPQMGMKKFVWSETRVSGRRPVGRLAPLPANPGPFQDVATSNHFGHEDVVKSPFARDVAVLAYPAPAGDLPLGALHPVITASGATGDLAALVDDRLVDPRTITPDAEGKTWVRFDFDHARTMRALTYAALRGGARASGRIEASDDGRNWRSLRTLVGQAHSPAPQRTFAFPATTARHFRVVFDAPVAGGLMLAELAFVPGARADLFEDRAGFGVLKAADAIATPTIDPTASIRSPDILDLSQRLRADGTLDWTPPKGDWIILRTGYSLTGQLNHPATPEGTGLEVDKLNAGHVRAHLDAYVTPVLQKTADAAGKPGLQYLLTDSWEAQQANWTEAMIAEFRTRRGYDPVPFLPALAGRVVDGAERTDAFLWDFRRTIADLVAENHYGTITRFAREHGLGYYGEATGASWPTVADGMQAKSLTDIPMGEFWTMPFGGEPGNFLGTRSDAFPADIIETRSTAHVYGKPLVAAEALTSSLPQWVSTPWNLKWIADKYMAMGVNRLVLHTSPHQPGDRGPGLSLAPFGQVFTRLETWGEMARPWIDYLSRTSFLLQQGTPVADLLYFYGEGAPSGVPYDSAGAPPDPRGFGFDYVNADALLRLAKVVNGRIVFPGGASYSVLVLPPDLKRMTLPLISRLRDLVRDGAVVAGPKPTGSPSLASDGAAVATIADQMWGQTDGRSLLRNDFGKGRVYWRTDVESLLDDERIGRDFDYASLDPAMRLEFNHRHLTDGDIYFVTNQSDRSGAVSMRFRTGGKAPEIWDAASGERRRTTYRPIGDTTEVPVDIAPYQSFFVIFRRPARAEGETFAPPVPELVTTLADRWQVDFPAPNAGAGTTASLPAGSWTNLDDPDVRYFSGVATYRQTMRVRRDALGERARLFLELGKVGGVAEVVINGRSAGVAWQPPYSVEVTGLLRAGENRIEVRVANSWQNRMIGDLQPGAPRRAFTNPPTGIGKMLEKKLLPDSPLIPSGLLAPVRLVAVDRTEQ